tara:strand:- start:276 stop:629 length:354 start_codon:yes stop_codon:yes gene_type:complete
MEIHGKGKSTGLLDDGRRQHRPGIMGVGTIAGVVMKVGDLVRIPTCTNELGEPPGQACTCFFCWGKSSRIGVVTDVEDPIVGPYSRKYRAMFDIGSWSFSEREIQDPTLIEVISASR